MSVKKKRSPVFRKETELLILLLNKYADQSTMNCLICAKNAEASSV